MEGGEGEHSSVCLECGNPNILLHPDQQRLENGMELRSQTVSASSSVSMLSISGLDPATSVPFPPRPATVTTRSRSVTYSDTEKLVQQVQAFGTPPEPSPDSSRAQAAAQAAKASAVAVLNVAQAVAAERKKEEAQRAKKKAAKRFKVVRVYTRVH